MPKVLIIDDEKAIRNTLKEILSYEKFEVDEAADGAEGIRKFCQQKTVVIDRFGLKEEFPWYPATEKKAKQIRHLLNLLCHSGFSHKWRALRGLMGS